MNDRVMIKMGDKNVVFDSLETRIINNHNLQIQLADGSYFCTHPDNATIYSKDSEEMKAYENLVSDIYYPYEGEVNEISTVDRAIVQMGNKSAALNFNDLRFVNAYTTVFALSDNTSVQSHPRNTYIYSSESVIMQQVENELMKQNEREREVDELDMSK